MNPERIYNQHRDDSLACQIAADKYSTFVAMPFSEQFSYYSQQIYTEVIRVAAERASKHGESRQFSHMDLTTSIFWSSDWTWFVADANAGFRLHELSILPEAQKFSRPVKLFVGHGIIMVCPE